MNDRAAVSVVVASFRGLDILAQCLESLRPQCARLGASLVLARARRESDAELARVAAGCRIVPAPPDAGVPLLRGLGLAAASGEWVAMIEDHCVADPGWLAALLAAADSATPVVGGSMGNARRERMTDWGAFFAEYGFYGVTGRGRAGQAPLITQANAAYHRSVLPSVAEWARSGSWENEIHDRLFAEGRRFRLVPTARVLQNLTYRLGAFCRDRFEHGRAYATTRTRNLGTARRILLCAGTPVLPLVLARRVFRSVDPDERRYWLRGVLPMLVFLSAWALGEAAGYARGAA